MQVHGLDLMGIQNRRVLSPHPRLDVQCAFSAIPSLFTPPVRERMLAELVEGKAWLQGGVHFLSNDEMNWGVYHASQDIVVPSCRTVRL